MVTTAKYRTQIVVTALVLSVPIYGYRNSTVYCAAGVVSTKHTLYRTSRNGKVYIAGILGSSYVSLIGSSVNICNTFSCAAGAAN